MFSHVKANFDHGNPLILKDSELQALDGTWWINIENMVRFQKEVEAIVHSKFHTKPESHTFAELVEQYRLQQLPPKLHKKILETGIRTFVHKATPYINQIRSLKKLMLRLVSEWSELRDHQNTLLLIWGCCRC